MKKKMLTEAPVKPVKKKRGAVPETPKEKPTPPEVKSRDTPDGCRVAGGQLRGVMVETMARVYEEIWPGRDLHDGRDGEVNIEVQEEAYILDLTMAVGNDVETPRKGLKVREWPISNGVRYCDQHKP